jgi:putative methyltransferase
MLNAYVHQFEGAISLGTLPLAAGLIVASAKKDPNVRAGFELVITTDRVDPDTLVDSYVEPSVIAMSCYPWNLCYSLRVAERAKARYPDCTVVFGGLAIAWHAEGATAFLARNAAVDVLVLGEGELTFRELLAAHLKGGDRTQIDGLALRSNEAPGGLLLTRPRARMDAEQLASEPSPFVDGTFDAYMSRRSGLFRALLETNRGCPYSCTFCVWGHKDQCRVYEFPTCRVEAELAWVASHFVPLLYLVDANFGLMKRDHDTVRELVRLRKQHGFPRSCYLNLTKNVAEPTLEIYRVLHEGGIHTHVELSNQDSNSQVLSLVKRFNLTEQRSKQLRTRCHELGLTTYNELILGLPAQTYDSVCDTIVGALSPLPADVFYVYLCRVVENSGMARAEYRAAHGIVTRTCVMVASDPAAMDESVADYEEIVVGTSTMPIEDWQRAYDFSNLVTVLSSMRLMDVVTRVLRFAFGADMKVFFRAILRRLSEPDTGASGEPSVLAALGRVLERYRRSILSGGALLLEAPGAGPTRWQIREALVIEAIRNYEKFVDELCAMTKGLIERSELGATIDSATLDELFRYQRFATPGFRRRRVVEERFTVDWLAYQRTGEGAHLLRSEDVVLRYQPPDYVTSSLSFSAFIGRHISAIYTERGTRIVGRIDGQGKASS